MAGPAMKAVMSTLLSSLEVETKLKGHRGIREGRFAVLHTNELDSRISETLNDIRDEDRFILIDRNGVVIQTIVYLQIFLRRCLVGIAQLSHSPWVVVSRGGDRGVSGEWQRWV